MSRVTIGSGAIVAAKAVVVKDVPPFAIVAGNPAKIVKMRFDNQIIEKLQQIAWWDWPIKKTNAHLKTLTQMDIKSLEKLISL